MALNQLMHPRNRYKDVRPDFKMLAEKYSEFKEHTTTDSKGRVCLVDVYSTAVMCSRAKSQDQGLNPRDEGLDLRDQGLNPRDEDLDLRDQGLNPRDEGLDLRREGRKFRGL